MKTAEREVSFKNCCDEIAKKRGYNNYKEFCKYALLSTQMMEEICELYAIEFARQRVTEAIDLARETELGRNTSFKQKYTKQEIIEILCSKA